MRNQDVIKAFVNNGKVAKGNSVLIIRKVFSYGTQDR